ncbi:unnamed protein product [Protopolystoma xenopodis]|uniref:acetate--CoA ligase n=1 Tax=Protopolystoma xenopodis TaxID=117903 RepID=A0A3S5BB20_9PLAT|nr:unnamed protein product [Protopolystoma xenopodis]
MAENSVNGWFVTPSSMRALRREDYNLKQSEEIRKTGLSNLRAVFLAGEHCDAETMNWLRSHLPPGIPALDNWWQSESGWPMTATCLGLYAPSRAIEKPTKFLNQPTQYRPRELADYVGLPIPPIGSAGCEVPGYKLEMFDTETVRSSRNRQAIDYEDEVSSSRGPLQRILVKRPMPPGFSHTLWKNDKGFHELYFTKYPVSHF